jgi:hypothetical protein
MRGERLALHVAGALAVIGAALGMATITALAPASLSISAAMSPVWAARLPGNLRPDRQAQALSRAGKGGNEVAGGRS